MKTWKIVVLLGLGLLIAPVCQQVGSAQQDSSPIANANQGPDTGHAYTNDGLAHTTQESAPPSDQLVTANGYIYLASDAELFGIDETSDVVDSVSRDTACQDTCGSDCGGDECVSSCVSRCCPPKWQFFGDFLYLRPGDSEVVYAVPADGPIDTSKVPIQVGVLGIVDPDYEPAFRVGFSRALNECARLGGTYTHFESSVPNQLSIAGPLVIRSMVIHPSTLNAGADWLEARATYDINFQLADVDYRRTFACGERYAASYLIGARYGHLEQRFRSVFTNIGTEYINTDVFFDGGGIRVGLEGERHAQCSGLLVYCNATASFVAGEFGASYFQGSDADPVIVNTSWKASRIVSILDLELGVGWESCSGCLRLTGGYVVSAWMNTVKTADFIHAVQQNNFSGLNGTTTFDGLVARAELRY